MIVLAILAPILCTSALFYLYFREKRRFINKLIEIQVPDQEGNTQVSNFTGAFARQIRLEIMNSIKGQELNQASQISRKMRGLEGAIAQDTLSMDPKMGAVLQMMPGVNKWVGKNPQLAQMIMGQLAGTMGQAAPDNHNEPVADAFNIK